jgi:hypothetical protein
MTVIEWPSEVRFLVLTGIVLLTALYPLTTRVYQLTEMYFAGLDLFQYTTGRRFLKRILLPLSRAISMPDVVYLQVFALHGLIAIYLLAKVGAKIRPGSALADWQRLLVVSDGVNRANDDFIEAHVYDGFNLYSIEALMPIPKKKMSKETRLDVRIAVDRFQRNLISRPK